MVLCQKEFRDFHDNIKLSEENEVLREKRQEIMDLINEKIEKTPNPFNQGSYAMHTGIKPLDGGDYDIDIGLYFDISKEDYKPMEVKEWVFNALEGQGSFVKIKVPCVTVEYPDGYHLDVAVYAASNDDGKVYMARGKHSSNSEEKVWFESNPKDLIAKIRDYSNDSGDREQFRRVVRYLKRWKDIKFDSVFGKPNGIGLTSAAVNWLIPKKETNWLDGKQTTTYQDLRALIYLVEQMIARFQSKTEFIDGELVTYERLEVKLPVSPGSDLFEKMTNTQMATFKEKLEKLLEALKEAEGKEEVSKATSILSKQFGSDFPVVETATKKAVRQSISHNSHSA